MSPSPTSITRNAYASTQPHIFLQIYSFQSCNIFTSNLKKKTSVEGYGMRPRLTVRYIQKGFSNHFNENHYKFCRQWIHCIYVRPQQKVNFWKRVKSGGRVFIMKSWWKELRPKGSLYCAGPHIDHMWLGAPPQPPSTSFDQRQRLRSSLSDRQHPRNTRNCQKLVEIVAREATHVLWPLVVYWRRGGIIFIGEQPSHKQSIWRLWSWLDEITLKALDDSQSICISFKTSIYTMSGS